MSRKQRPNRKVFQVLQRPIRNGTGTKGGGVAEFSQEMFHNKFRDYALDELWRKAPQHIVSERFTRYSVLKTN